ncbi:hypothetical protein LIPSTDRAFT_278177 [Lipomyces starkeyi NRRL Y-11557]|uniref:Uncharacterized protein n=1 Tax=Lipomyces starkeyi NRRL Y-11557 TaxID=675824 RepID=A0A1E3Q5J8_LIPST|nr:hypothetical protein LIPSTDRAFT_278177 [Lipomyces starkeyi NRRL Y-11557]
MIAGMRERKVSTLFTDGLVGFMRNTTYLIELNLMNPTTYCDGGTSSIYIYLIFYVLCPMSYLMSYVLCPMSYVLSYVL